MEPDRFTNSRVKVKTQLLLSDPYGLC